MATDSSSCKLHPTVTAGNGVPGAELFIYLRYYDGSGSNQLNSALWPDVLILDASRAPLPLPAPMMVCILLNGTSSTSPIPPRPLDNFTALLELTPIGSCHHVGQVQGLSPLVLAGKALSIWNHLGQASTICCLARRRGSHQNNGLKMDQ